MIVLVIMLAIMSYMSLDVGGTVVQILETGWSTMKITLSDIGITAPHGRPIIRRFLHINGGEEDHLLRNDTWLVLKKEKKQIYVYK